MIELVLGGARSGKSAFAERQMAQYTDIVYVATAIGVDEEMNARIYKHQQDRADKSWQTIECPLKLAKFINDADSEKAYLIECLSMWLNNLIYQYEQQQFSYEMTDRYLTEQREALLDTLQNSTITTVIVSNEVGFGITPIGQSTRLFVDHLGWLNQAIAKIASKVTLVCAGIPMVLKSSSTSKEQVSE